MEKLLRNEGRMKLVLCECGKLHITYGSATLHFDREDFLVFADSVSRLAAIVKQPSAGHTLASRQGVTTEVCH